MFPSANLDSPPQFTFAAIPEGAPDKGAPASLKKAPVNFVKRRDCEWRASFGARSLAQQAVSMQSFGALFQRAKLAARGKTQNHGASAGFDECVETIHNFIP